MSAAILTGFKTAEEAELLRRDLQDANQYVVIPVYSHKGRELLAAFVTRREVSKELER